MWRVFLGVLVSGTILIGCQQKAAPTGAIPSSAQHQSDHGATAPTGQVENREDVATKASKSEGARTEDIVTLDGLQFAVPKGWERKPVSSSFVAAEIALPHADGDSVDGRLTISSAGGGVGANIDRWKAQFKPQPKAASQQEIEIAGTKATLVDFGGDFNDQRGPFAPGKIRPNYRMIAAVLPVGGQLYFVKATGPEKTIATHAEAIRGFIQSAKLAK